jgi:hypothetical protein
MSAVDLAQALNSWWLRRYGADSMSGNCGKLAYRLAARLPGSQVVSGSFRGQPGNHAWVEHHGQILDPSVSQYGDYPVLGDPTNYLVRTRTTP